jgi:hypothetical protein
MMSVQRVKAAMGKQVRFVQSRVPNRPEKRKLTEE